jgi:hypothetical protein
MLLSIEARPVPGQFLAKPEEPVGCGPRQHPSDSKGPVRFWPEIVLFIGVIVSHYFCVVLSGVWH